MGFMVPRSRLSIIALLSPMLVGCQSMPWMHTPATAVTADAPQPVASEREGAAPEPPSVQQAASFTEPSDASTNSASASEQVGLSDEVLAELQTIGSVDPAAAQQLVERLQTTKESLRPLVARQFRTSWQYHRELAGKTDVAASATQALPHRTHLPNSTTAEPTPLPPADTLPTYQQHHLPNSASPGMYAPQNLEPSAQAEPMPKVDPTIQTAGYDESPKLMPVPDAGESSPRPAAEPPRDWRQLANESIERLASQTTAEPRSTADAYQHVRLRLMQLAAGNNQQALEPIPGLTPTEQTYWTNQLFALSTLLDHEALPDEQQRAGLAESQLNEAVGRLGELSNLAVRNLAFCQKVYGYGDYDKTESGKFKPGAAVTLYAEVDHYRSESTEKGYHTSLATSYEILDQAGNRVDGGEFATVDDYCGRKRNDFYIEYTIGLPDRIYASHYKLRVLIRDRLSGKIGKSSIEFEIAE